MDPPLLSLSLHSCRDHLQLSLTTYHGADCTASVQLLRLAFITLTTTVSVLSAVYQSYASSSPLTRLKYLETVPHPVQRPCISITPTSQPETSDSAVYNIIYVPVKVSVITRTCPDASNSRRTHASDVLYLAKSVGYVDKIDQLVAESISIVSTNWTAIPISPKVYWRASCYWPIRSATYKGKQT